MGIERLDPNLHSTTSSKSCKKSPQTWGLKGLVEKHACLVSGNLQKESPNMGIERVKLLSPSGEVYDLQKESPNMGIERSWRFMQLQAEATPLQKESPNMGIESIFP